MDKESYFNKFNLELPTLLSLLGLRRRRRKAEKAVAPGTSGVLKLKNQRGQL